MDFLDAVNTLTADSSSTWPPFPTASYTKLILSYLLEANFVNHNSEFSNRSCPKWLCCDLQTSLLPSRGGAPGCLQWLNRASPPTPEHHHAADLFCGARMTPIHDSLAQQQRCPQEEDEGGAECLWPESWWQLMESVPRHHRLLPRRVRTTTTLPEDRRRGVEDQTAQPIC